LTVLFQITNTTFLFDKLNDKNSIDNIEYYFFVDDYLVYTALYIFFSKILKKTLLNYFRINEFYIS